VDGFLRDGDKVEFEVAEDEKGAHAENVKKKSNKPTIAY